MNKPLLPRLVHPGEKPLEECSIIERYNVFIRNYNTPNNMLNEVSLEEAPNSYLSTLFFQGTSTTSGKSLFIFLLLVPAVNVLVVLLCGYALVIYMLGLAAHQRNKGRVADPFKKMVFDPQMCFNLKKDYYLFSIEFKELQGFSLNYNKEIRKELNLREERGKANFMIYNANFWASYHHFPNFRARHISLLMVALMLVFFVNFAFFIFIF